MNERAVPMEINPTDLLYRDGQGDMIRLFRTITPRDVPPQDAPCLLMTTLEVNREALTALQNSAFPRLYLDHSCQKTARRPKITMEFQYDVEESLAHRVDDDVFQIGVANPQNPLRGLSLLGAACVIVHTDFKFVRTTAAGELRDARGQRRTLARIEEIPGVSHAHFLAPHTIFYVIPKLMIPRKAEIEAEMRSVLVESAEFVWQHATLPLAESE